MASEWPIVTVTEVAAKSENALATGPFGSAISSKFFRSAGVPVLRGSNLSEHVGERLNDDGLVFVDNEKAREFSRSVARRGDLIFTCWGTIGQVGIVDNRARYNEYIVSNKQMKLTPDPQKADSLFLYYCFSGPSLLDEIKNRAIGSSVPGFNLGQLKALSFRLPPLAEQRAIAHILGTLDDKIELNRRTNETLEAMARALFKSWFVDFDPVRAKAAGRKPVGMDEATAALFPDAFEQSELGEIPRGWRVVGLDEIADFKNGLALQKFRPEEGEPRLPVVKIAQLRTGLPDSGEWARADIDPACILLDGDIVFSWSGSLAVVLWCGGRAALNQHLFRVTSNHVPRYFYLGWLLAHLPEFQRIASAKATTMGHIQRHHLSAARCVLPPSKILQTMGSILGPLLQKQILSSLESRNSQNIRDALLPRLLSGEISTADVQVLGMNGAV